jgi:pimeloyl-ACP methyl ester carboxylesterase
MVDGSQLLVDSMTPKLFSPDTLRLQGKLVAAQQRVIRENDRRGLAAALRGMAQRSDFTARLGVIRCPVLVLVGQEDAISSPAEMQAIARALPRSRFVEIPRAAHLSPLEQPAAVNRAMEQFLDILP